MFTDVINPMSPRPHSSIQQRIRFNSYLRVTSYKKSEERTGRTDMNSLCIKLICFTKILDLRLSYANSYVCFTNKLTYVHSIVLLNLQKRNIFHKITMKFVWNSSTVHCKTAIMPAPWALSEEMLASEISIIEENKCNKGILLFFLVFSRRVHSRDNNQ
ncbi:hypothetical protein LOTGIDRAFT_231246 [Lottia gigantea]|uniref:Uncharacterized protein n=1 Tax=Lottia gigantea TaxID=225164 RepID=V4CAS7_LOTGI|nr:hypothetical protein LOTGIDRAFT_231246 [Lottia gigantea]ESO98919.1 hypothetical protein LOTGIDRAFT_231246 [Lottia gigantea]